MTGLSTSLEDYLEAVYFLCRDGGSARASRVGALLGVSKPSVSAAMKTLAARGLVSQERYGRITLSPSGVAAGGEIAGRHAMLKDFFTSILGMDPAAAEADACRAEHAISREALARMGRLAAFLKGPARRSALAAARRSAAGRRP